MHGTLDRIPQATRRHRPRTTTFLLLTAAAMLAGMMAGAVLTYYPPSDALLRHLGITPAKDCG
jgi:hypothetical protein